MESVRYEPCPFVFDGGALCQLPKEHPEDHEPEARLMYPIEAKGEISANANINLTVIHENHDETS